MSKAVLMSIQPKWCELIASGKKTVEVRKTQPKIKTPFKVYIYCTANKQGAHDLLEIHGTDGKIRKANGKVIGEFVCDEIIKVGNYQEVDYSYMLWVKDRETTKKFCKNACLDEFAIQDYLGAKGGYGWHISDLVIYDKPKELSEFYYGCNKFDLDKKEVYEAYCTDCGNKFGIAPCKYINKKWCVPITRPPRSWCYIEELG